MVRSGSFGALLPFFIVLATWIPAAPAWSDMAVSEGSEFGFLSEQLAKRSEPPDDVLSCFYELTGPWRDHQECITAYQKATEFCFLCCNIPSNPRDPSAPNNPDCFLGCTVLALQGALSCRGI